MGRLAATAFLLAGLWLCGCAGYQLGPTDGTAAGARSIQVVPFLNETLEPRLTDAVTTEVRKEFQRDATYRLDTHGEADVVLTGRIMNYARRVQSLAPRDTASGLDYRLEIKVQITARERSTGRTVLEQTVNGTTLIRVGDDLVSSERQALPLLANDLARRVVSALADGTW